MLALFLFFSIFPYEFFYFQRNCIFLLVCEVLLINGFYSDSKRVIINP